MSVDVQELIKAASEALGNVSDAVVEVAAEVDAIADVAITSIENAKAWLDAQAKPAAEQEAQAQTGGSEQPSPQAMYAYLLNSNLGDPARKTVVDNKEWLLSNLSVLKRIYDVEKSFQRSDERGCGR